MNKFIFEMKDPSKDTHLRQTNNQEMYPVKYNGVTNET
ncbi:hypothetical protein N481_22335 [Pseudoalteromonas luteoviolacea S4047-1]|uniref:Uncharacterized protein n=1 Tax=Pseudoalteromonas luteoviolacea S4054 TaxID=1129367 RepID=A0A0F6AEA6_9GAMM|nr:hypothetical protein N479_08705 [Pseudoalteromonas luteoviolacea S4054]KZN69533.1 hypothetical protein N481_22335 [Pseudoalteromonas luteoviolacea S4047-1]